MKKISSRFSVAVHILLLVARNDHLTSDTIARSVNTNPVLIRKILAKLKKAGLVNVRPGVGGAYLLKALEEITLLDVYRAVEVVENNDLFNFHDRPSPDCPVGAHIESVFRSNVLQAQAAMERELGHTTLKQLETELNDKIKISSSKI